jgi:hypothetical protein
LGLDRSLFALEPDNPGVSFDQLALTDQIFLPYHAGGMGLQDPNVLHKVSYLAMWRFLLVENRTLFEAAVPSLGHLGDIDLFSGITEAEVQTEDVSLFPFSLIKCLHATTGTLDSSVPLAKLPFIATVLAARTDGDEVSFRSLSHENMSQRFLAKAVTSENGDRLKTNCWALYQNPSAPPEQRAAAFRRHQSLITGSADGAATCFIALPTDHISTLTNPETTFTAELRFGIPFSMAKGLHTCHTCTQEGVNISADGGSHFIHCKSCNPGKASHGAVIDVIQNTFQSYTSVKADLRQIPINPNRQPGQPGLVPDIRFIRYGEPIVYLDVSSTSASASSNLTASSSQQTLFSAAVVERAKRAKYGAAAQAAGGTFLPYVMEATGGFGTSTKAVEAILAAEVTKRGFMDVQLVLRKFRKDVAFAHRKGYYRQVQFAVLKGSGWTRNLDTEANLRQAGYR